MLEKIKSWFYSKFSTEEIVSTPPVVIIRSSGWTEKYDQIIIDNLKWNNHMLEYSTDPLYWVAFFKALSKTESNHNTFLSLEKNVPRGTIDPVTGKTPLTEGLLQISLVNAKYAKVSFVTVVDTRKERHDPTKNIFNAASNLKCGMSILNRTMKKSSIPFSNRESYWDVLKPSCRRHKVFRSYLNKYIMESLK